MKNDKKNRVDVVYSTNPNFSYEYEQEEEMDTLAPEKQNLRVTLDAKQRKGFKRAFQTIKKQMWGRWFCKRW